MQREALILASLEELLEAAGGRPIQVAVLGGVAGGIWRVVRVEEGNGKLRVTLSSFAGTLRGERRANGADTCGHHHGREQPLGG